MVSVYKTDSGFLSSAFACERTYSAVVRWSYSPGPQLLGNVPGPAGGLGLGPVPGTAPGLD